MSHRHRVAAELKRLDKLDLDYTHRTFSTPTNVTMAFVSPYTAQLMGDFLRMALQGYRRPVLVHNGRKPRK